ncbi:related to protein conferring sensitivity to killer toxin [Ramularia collo-cygni]|uniref:Elongator complex protein 5 n=1 Tax=Ramularia collo-cygni TaxID=112498 RepID=A0A2D3VB20_9PEZI|nr:related to protein conferring sensitivity to killer toxin [Ramularia collo-cygni]CZT18759.1 related to protein conferring sensitivity to killer toxin [Ramularia collo-cygni]
MTEKLLVLDDLTSLAAINSTNLPGLLSSFIGPSCSLLALYHLDVPLPTTKSAHDPYAPSTLTLLRYLATTIFTVHSLHHVLARKAARERSHAEPSFGLDQGVEGVLQGLGANGVEDVVVEMEHRRKSGRGVREWYFLPHFKSAPASSTSSTRPKEIVILLEDHAQYRSPEPTTGGAPTEGVEADTTFELGLTERQKRDREGVVLPYFDAQNGGGDGGRILYDLGSEDDFDEDEDEI